MKSITEEVHDLHEKFGPYPDAAGTVVPFPTLDAKFWRPSAASKAALAARIGWTPGQLEAFPWDGVAEVAGYVPPTAAPVPFDGSPAQALLYLGCGFNPQTGTRNFGSAPDLEHARGWCDKISDAPTAAAASALIPMAGDLDTDAACAMCMAALVTGGSLGGSPQFQPFPRGTHLADVLALEMPQVPIGGNVAR